MRWAVWVAALTGFGGLAAAGSGGLVYLKAQLAQLLLMQAWERSVKVGHPQRPWPWADTWPVGRLRASENDLVVLAGASGEALAFGPGWLSASAPPTDQGTTVIAGHRDTHFEFLEGLRLGEVLSLQGAAGTARRYRVDELRVVDSRAWRMVLDPAEDQLLLVTCYPFDGLVSGGPLRYVVRAGLVEN